MANTGSKSNYGQAYSNTIGQDVIIDKDAIIKNVDAMNGDDEASADARAHAEEEILAAYEDMRSALRSGKITEAGLRRLAGINDINVDEMVRFANMSRLDMEKDPLYKSDLSDAEETTTINGVSVFPENNGDVIEAGGVKLTRTGDHSIKCESEYLGNFEYNDRDFALTFKAIDEDDGSTSYLPYLKYKGVGSIGMTFTEGQLGLANTWPDEYDRFCSDMSTAWDEGHYLKAAGNFLGATFSAIPAYADNIVNGVASGFDDNQTYGKDTVDVPDGLKVMDYMFDGHQTLEHFPTKIPDSVTSMHATFKGCSSMTVDYKGHDDQIIDLPSGITDLSLAFKGCSSLQCEFYSDKKRQLPESVVNITEMLNECESVSDGKAVANATSHGHRNMGFSRYPWRLTKNSAVLSVGYVDYKLPNVGGDYTPYLSAALARDWLAGISGKEDREYVKQYADNIEYLVDYSGAISDKFKEKAKSLDQEKLDKVQTASAMYYQGDSHLGSIMDHTELVSGGARSDNKIMNEDGTFSYDETGLKNSFQAETDGDTFLMKMAMYGGTALAGTAATDIASRLLTKNKFHNIYVNLAGGVIGTVAMSAAFPKLYESAYPVLTTIRDHIPDKGVFSGIRSGLDDYINEHYASRIVNDKVAKRNKMWDDADSYDMAVAYLAGKDPNGDDLKYANDGVRPAVSPLTDIFDRTYNMAYLWNENECDKLMKNSAMSCAETDTFLALATYLDLDTKEFKDCSVPVTESIETGTNKIEEFWKKCQSQIEAGEATNYDEETLREDMRDFYTTMLHAISTYDEESYRGIAEHYGVDTRDCRLAREGLGMVNSAYMTALVHSMQEMDSEFHFMNDDVREKLDELHLTGVKVNGINSVEHVAADTYADDRQAFWERRYKDIDLPEQQNEPTEALTTGVSQVETESVDEVDVSTQSQRELPVVSEVESDQVDDFCV